MDEVELPVIHFEALFKFKSHEKAFFLLSKSFKVRELIVQSFYQNYVIEDPTFL